MSCKNITSKLASFMNTYGSRGVFTLSKEIDFLSFMGKHKDEVTTEFNAILTGKVTDMKIMLINMCIDSNSEDAQEILKKWLDEPLIADDREKLEKLLIRAEITDKDTPDTIFEKRKNKLMSRSLESCIWTYADMWSNAKTEDDIDKINKFIDEHKERDKKRHGTEYDGYDYAPLYFDSILTWEELNQSAEIALDRIYERRTGENLPNSPALLGDSIFMRQHEEKNTPRKRLDYNVKNMNFSTKEKPVSIERFVKVFNMNARLANKVFPKNPNTTGRIAWCIQNAIPFDEKIAKETLKSLLNGLSIKEFDKYMYDNLEDFQTIRYSTRWDEIRPF